MSWQKRYVEAVRRYLPKNLREDVGDELQSLLADKFADATEAKGAPLDDSESVRVLREFGHPLKVASGYQGHRVLIGEALFPAYKQALRYLLLGLLTVFVTTSILAESGALPGDPRINFFETGLFYAALLTVGFHLLDRYLRQVDFFAHWNPSKLPLTHPGLPAVTLGQSIGGVIGGLMWFWLLAALSDDYSWPTLMGESGSRAATIILWLKVHAVLSLGLNLINLYRPHWTRQKLSFKALNATMFAVIAVTTLMSAEIGRAIIGDAYGQIQPLTWVMDLNLRLILASLAAVAIVESFRTLRKFVDLS